MAGCMPPAHVEVVVVVVVTRSRGWAIGMAVGGAACIMAIGGIPAPPKSPEGTATDGWATAATVGTAGCIADGSTRCLWNWKAMRFGRLSASFL